VQGEIKLPAEWAGLPSLVSPCWAEAKVSLLVPCPDSEGEVLKDCGQRSGLENVPDLYVQAHIYTTPYNLKLKAPYPALSSLSAPPFITPPKQTNKQKMSVQAVYQTLHLRVNFHGSPSQLCYHAYLVCVS
jgi:hypothetical protein